jgi:hypothetical protein
MTVMATLLDLQFCQSIYAWFSPMHWLACLHGAHEQSSVVDILTTEHHSTLLTNISLSVPISGFLSVFYSCSFLVWHLVHLPMIAGKNGYTGLIGYFFTYDESPDQ